MSTHRRHSASKYAVNVATSSKRNSLDGEGPKSPMVRMTDRVRVESIDIESSDRRRVETVSVVRVERMVWQDFALSIFLCTVCAGAVIASRASAAAAAAAAADADSALSVEGGGPEADMWPLRQAIPTSHRLHALNDEPAAPMDTVPMDEDPRGTAPPLYSNK